VATVEQIIATQLTNDFWEVTLPDALETSGTYSPALFALVFPALVTGRTLANTDDPAAVLNGRLNRLLKAAAFARIRPVATLDNWSL
jgi:hypothetical protein